MPILENELCALTHRQLLSVTRLLKMSKDIEVQIRELNLVAFVPLLLHRLTQQFTRNIPGTGPRVPLWPFSARHFLQIVRLVFEPPIALNLFAPLQKPRHRRKVVCTNTPQRVLVANPRL